MHREGIFDWLRCIEIVNPDRRREMTYQTLSHCVIFKDSFMLAFLLICIFYIFTLADLFAFQNLFSFLRKEDIDDKFLLCHFILMDRIGFPSK